MSELLPAVPGWRAVLVDRESGSSEALPVLFWERCTETAAVLGSYHTYEYLRPWFAPNEIAALPRALSEHDSLLGFLAPGDEHEPFWHDHAVSALESERLREDLEAQERKGRDEREPPA